MISFSFARAAMVFVQAAGIAALAVSGPCLAGTQPAGQAIQLAALGKAMFFDPALSSSGTLSCASCHSPDHAYGPPDGKPVQFGGPNRDRPGARAVPSLRYVLNRTPIWYQEHPAGLLDRMTEKDLSPVGGFAWDGRFDSLSAQAAFPLLAANEMDNRDRGGVVAKLAAAPYAAQFRRIFGDDVFADADQAFARAMSAIAQFELDDPSFHPYTSKFDLYLDGKVRLSDQERRGKALFDDPHAGNCASCHLDAQGGGWLAPLADRLSVRGAGRAAQRSASAKTPIRITTIWGFAGRRGAIMPTSRPIAGCSKPRPCGTWRRAASSSIMAGFIR